MIKFMLYNNLSLNVYFFILFLNRRNTNNIMKKVLVLVVAILNVMSVNAQKSKVVSAFNYLKYNELEKAKVAIDKAVNHEKTMNWEKAWFYRGLVYDGIYSECIYKGNQEYCDLAPDAGQIAFDAYMKSISLNFKDPKWADIDFLHKEADRNVFINLLQDDKNFKNIEIKNQLRRERFQSIANILVNLGVKHFESSDAEENKKAIESFESSLFFSSMMGKTDTVLYYYTALAAQKVKDHETAVEYLNKCAKFNYGETMDNKSHVYKMLANNYMSMGDTVKFIESLKTGIDKYPENNTALVPELINYYLLANKNQEALDYLKVAIEKVPDNKTYHFAQGSLYDKLKNYPEAENSYKNALKLDSNYFDANYNLGAIFYNLAVQTYDEASQIPPSKPKEYDAKVAEAKEQLKQAMPYLEKAFETNSEDVNTMLSLKEIYARLSMYDKSKEMKTRIEALKAN